jgi:hypothetical protein
MRRAAGGVPGFRSFRRATRRPRRTSTRPCPFRRRGDPSSVNQGKGKGRQAFALAVFIRRLSRPAGVSAKLRSFAPSVIGAVLALMILSRPAAGQTPPSELGQGSDLYVRYGILLRTNGGLVWRHRHAADGVRPAHGDLGPVSRARLPEPPEWGRFARHFGSIRGSSTRRERRSAPPANARRSRWRSIWSASGNSWFRALGCYVVSPCRAWISQE